MLNRNEKKAKKRGDFNFAYCVPVKTILTLNVESAPAFDEAARVNVADVIAPAVKVDDVGDQVTVR